MEDKFRSIVKDVPPSIVVFLIALPLSMGIAQASGMPASLGLITAAVGGVTVGFLGGAPLQISGPSAGLSVLVLDWVGAFRTEEDPYGIASIAVVISAIAGPRAPTGIIVIEVAGIDVNDRMMGLRILGQ